MGLKFVGDRSCIYKPIQIDNAKNISIGTKTFVGHYSWLIGSEDSQYKGLVIGD